MDKGKLKNAKLKEPNTHISQNSPDSKENIFLNIYYLYYN